MILAVILILVLGSTKNRLTGKWSDTYGEKYKTTVKVNFKADGTGEYRKIEDERSLTIEFDWSLSRTNKLTIKITGVDDKDYHGNYQEMVGREDILRYREEQAKESDEGYWYIDGRTLYLNSYDLSGFDWLELAKG